MTEEKKECPNTWGHKAALEIMHRYGDGTKGFDLEDDSCHVIYRHSKPVRLEIDRLRAENEKLAELIDLNERENQVLREAFGCTVITAKASLDSAVHYKDWSYVQSALEMLNKTKEEVVDGWVDEALKRADEIGEKK